MAESFGDAIRNVLANAFVDTLDGGSLKIYDATGGVPADVTVAITGQVLLVDINPLPTPAFGAAAAGVASLSGVWSDASANASGTAAFFRLVTSGAVEHLQGTVTGVGGGGEIELSNVVIGITDVVTMSTFTYTQPAS